MFNSYSREGCQRFQEKYKDEIQKRDELNELLRSISNPNYVEVK